MFEDMEKTLEKYYLILENDKKEYPRFKEIIENIQKMIKSGKSDYSKDSKVLINFESMVDNLEFKNLTLEEKMQIILYLLRLNVYNWGLDKESFAVNIGSILDYPFKTISKAKIKKMLEDDSLRDFFVTGLNE